MTAKIWARDTNGELRYAEPIILHIAEGSASCKDTTGPCRTAAQASLPLVNAMEKYAVYESPEIAAILSLMAMETVDFQYDVNVSPGRPGQGTRNMQMPDFNLEYAKSIPEVAAQLPAEIMAATSTAGMTDEQKNQMLKLLLPDEYSFASGAWFYATKCDDDVKSTLRSSPDEGFVKYMGCVGAEIDDTRQAYWTKAKEAFKLL